MADRHELYEEFLHEFPLETLREMPLEKYTNLNRTDSFCYWLESRTYGLGSVWGGTSYKFGIYRYTNKPKAGDSRIVSDDAYAWYKRYGKDSASEAYEIVRNAIVDIAKAAESGNFDLIDGNFILGESIKWKIAFLYSGLKLLPIYKKEMLNSLASGMGMEDAQSHSVPEIQRFLMDSKPEDKDLFDYYDSMLTYLNQSKPVTNKDLFEAVKKSLENDDRFEAGKIGRSFIWIGTRDGVIGNTKCHYEILTGNDKKSEHAENTAYVEIHFEGNNASSFKSLASISGLREFSWNNLGIRAVDAGLSTIGTSAEDLAEALIEQLRILDDAAASTIASLMNDNHQYWMYSPGDGARAWEECSEKNIMVLGWDELGDFSLYPDKESLRAAIQETYGGEGSHKNDVLAVWQFRNELKAGDVVYAKKGRYTIVGRGIVSTDEYTFDETRDNYMSVRKIQWTHTGEWILEESTAMKTLTNISAYSDYVASLEEMILGEKKEKAMEKKHKEYIELLLASRNLILTGAPGTGKTYLAKMIAAEMGAETEFVQFHPSYDYTDFVEGLRPTNNGAFERKNGIFKTFCKKAIRNLEDSKKSQEILSKEHDLDEKIDRFLADAVENGTEMVLKSGNRFVIKEYDEKMIRVESKDNEKTPHIDIKMSEVHELLEKEVALNNVHDVRDYFGRKFGTQQDSYTFVIASAIRAIKSSATTSVSKVDRKDFVFIIDEINRGEMSKILGELFFSIDPGYRGENGRVKTQYQNLVDEDDLFSKGFYIPENVYIIGTMNDIDRSVESMDFAIRRRFTWKEVLPEDRLDMWDDCTGDWKEEAGKRLSRINEVISNGDIGLAREYSIGPAYFRNLDRYNGDFTKLWELHIEPLVREYMRGNRNIIENLETIRKAYELVDEPEQDHNDF